MIEPLGIGEHQGLLAKNLSTYNPTHKEALASILNTLDRNIIVDIWCRIGIATPVGLKQEEWAAIGEITIKKQDTLREGNNKDKQAWIREKLRLQESPFLQKPGTMTKLENLLLEYHNVIRKTKIEVYNTVFCPILL